MIRIIPILLSLQTCSSFTTLPNKRTKSTTLQATFFPQPKQNEVETIQDKTFTPPNPTQNQITDPDCISAASKMRRAIIPVPESISPSGEVGVSYVHWPAEGKKNVLPIILIHGFDSSALEYRRLGPQLAKKGVDVYAVDLLGWGYTQLENGIDYSAEAKVQALCSFWKTVGGDKPVAVCGASLGGAAAIEYAAMGDPVSACVFLDAQGFVDGTGPVVSMLPKPLAKLGVGVLKSEWLRESANQMSYFDKAFATEDALKVGRMHCLQEGWEDSLLSFMSSGGFKPKNKVPLVQQQTCVIWGRNDEILNGDEFANKFMETLPNEKNQLNWIEECGHVPHLEQPVETAGVIFDFLSGIECEVEVEEVDNTALVGVVGVASAASAALIAASTFAN